MLISDPLAAMVRGSERLCLYKYPTKTALQCINWTFSSKCEAWEAHGPRILTPTVYTLKSWGLVFRWGWGQLAECLPGMPTALGSTPAPHTSGIRWLIYLLKPFASSLSTVQWYESMTGSQELTRAINSICRLAQRRGIQDKPCLLTDWLFTICPSSLRTQECLQEQIEARVTSFPVLEQSESQV